MINLEAYCHLEVVVGVDWLPGVGVDWLPGVEVDRLPGVEVERLPRVDVDRLPRVEVNDTELKMTMLHIEASQKLPFARCRLFPKCFGSVSKTRLRNI
jgi:hypothetical protein